MPNTKHKSVRSGRWSLFSLGGNKSEDVSEESSSPDQVFGQPVPTDPGQLPSFLFHAFDTLRPYQEEQGIFRISGDADEIKSFRQRIDAGETVDFATASTPHVVAGVLKLYFRELPEPLLTYDLYDMFIAADSVKVRDAQVELIRRVLKFLPAGNLHLLHSLCHFLHAVSQYQGTNLMPPPNLAIVFAPNLLRPRQESTQVVMGDYPMANALVTIMIENCHDIFGSEPPQQPVAPARPKPRLDAHTHAKAKRLSVQQQHHHHHHHHHHHQRQPSSTPDITPSRPGSMRSRNRARNRRATALAAATSASETKPLPTPEENDAPSSESGPDNLNPNSHSNPDPGEDQDKPAKPPKPEGGLGKPTRPGTFGAGDLRRASMHRSLRRSVKPSGKRSKALPETPTTEKSEKKDENEDGGEEDVRREGKEDKKDDQGGDHAPESHEGKEA